MGDINKFAVFCVSEIKSQLKGNQAVFCTIISTIAVTLAAVLVLINILGVSVSDINEINKRKCIYSPNAEMHTTWSEMCGELSELSDILEGDRLPPVESYDCDLSVECTYKDYLTDGSGTWYTVGLRIIPCDNSRLSLDTLESAEHGIISGEMPNVMEKHEPPMILLKQDTRENFFPESNAGDAITIGDRQYKTAAILACDDNYEAVGMDYKNYVLGADLEDGENVSLLIQNIVFTEPLSSSQRKYFNQFLSRYDGADNPNAHEYQMFGEIMTYVTYCAIVVILLLFCMVTIVRLFRYVFTDRLYVYNIYKIHGIRQRSLAAVLAVDVMLITLISSVLGIILFVLSKPIQRYFYISCDTPVSIIVTVIAAILVLTVLTSLPTIRKLAVRPPLDRTFWR